MTQEAILQRLKEIECKLNNGLEDEYADRQLLCEDAQSMLVVLIDTIEQDNR